jgi:hypothetical protein
MIFGIFFFSMANAQQLIHIDQIHSVY